MRGDKHLPAIHHDELAAFVDEAWKTNFIVSFSSLLNPLTDDQGVIDVSPPAEPEPTEDYYHTFCEMLVGGDYRLRTGVTIFQSTDYEIVTRFDGLKQRREVPSRPESGSSFFVFRLPSYAAWRALAPVKRDEEGGELYPADGALPFGCFGIQVAEKLLKLVVPFKTPDTSPRSYLPAAEHLAAWSWLRARLTELVPGSVLKDYQIDNIIFLPKILGFQRFTYLPGPPLEVSRIPQGNEARALTTLVAE